jgi:hypothetical protein
MIGRIGDVQSIDDRTEAIGKQPFRAKFNLRGRDRATALLRGRARSAPTRATAILGGTPAT